MPDTYRTKSLQSSRIFQFQIAATASQSSLLESQSDNIYLWNWEKLNILWYGTKTGSYLDSMKNMDVNITISFTAWSCWGIFHLPTSICSTIALWSSDSQRVKKNVRVLGIIHYNMIYPLIPTWKLHGYQAEDPHLAAVHSMNCRNLKPASILILMSNHTKLTLEGTPAKWIY